MTKKNLIQKLAEPIICFLLPFIFVSCMGVNPKKDIDTYKKWGIKEFQNYKTSGEIYIRSLPYSRLDKTPITDVFYNTDEDCFPEVWERYETAHPFNDPSKYLNKPLMYLFFRDDGSKVIIWDGDQDGLNCSSKERIKSENISHNKGDKDVTPELDNLYLFDTSMGSGSF